MWLENAGETQLNFTDRSISRPKVGEVGFISRLEKDKAFVLA
jgi:hypothetical protein